MHICMVDASGRLSTYGFARIHWLPQYQFNSVNVYCENKYQYTFVKNINSPVQNIKLKYQVIFVNEPCEDKTFFETISKNSGNSLIVATHVCNIGIHQLARIHEFVTHSYI